MRSGLRRARSAFRPQAAGAPVPYASGFYGLPGLPGFNADDTYIRTYGTSGTIFSIVSLFAEATAGVEWRLYRKEKRDGRVRYTTGDRGSDQRVEVLTHPALSLWSSPNTFMPQFTFVETFVTQFELTAKAFWVLDRDERFNLPLSMWPVTPSRMEPVPSDTDFLAGWIYTSPNGEKVPLKVEEVVWMRRPDPADPYGAVGAVQTVLTDIDAAKYSSEYNRNFFLNNGIPGGILALDGSLSEPQFTELADNWREQHLGISRAHRVAVLENTKAQFLMTGTNQKDMDFVNLQLQARDKMREAWRMHKHMLGTVDDVNRANAQTAEEIFAAWGETPRLNRIKLTLNHQLLPMYGTLGQDVEFDYQDPVPQNREADARELLGKAQAVLWLTQAGYDQAAVLEAVGLPSMDVVQPPAGTQAGAPRRDPEQDQSAGTPSTPEPGSNAPKRADVAAARAAYEDMQQRLVAMLNNGYKPVDFEPIRLKVGA